MSRRFSQATVLLLAAALWLLAWPPHSAVAQVPEPVATEAPAHTESTEAVPGHAEATDAREHQVIEFDPATAIWVLIIFVILLIILYPTAWKNVLAGLKGREEKIRKDIADAEAARGRAEATLREYAARMDAADAHIRELIAQATAEGERMATTIRLHAQEEAEQIKEKATRDIEASRDQAIREIYRQTADLATSVAEKILRRNLTAADQQDLVDRSLEQFQSLNRG